MSQISQTLTTNVTELSNVQIQSIGKRVYNAVVLAAEKAVGHLSDPRKFPMPTDKGSLENILLDRLRSRPSYQQERAKAHFSKLLSANSRQRTRLLGELGQINLRTQEPIIDQVQRLPSAVKLSEADVLNLPPHGPIFTSHTMSVAVDADLDHLAPLKSREVSQVNNLLQENKLRKLQELLKEVEFPEKGSQSLGLDFIKPWSKLQLRIHKTKCIDETDGFLGSEAGDDEIRLSGYLIDPTGEMKKANFLNLGDSFDDGEVVSYAPPKIFDVHNIEKETIKINGKMVEIGWPRSYYATLILAEQDNGGFPEFLNNVLNAIKGWVKSEVVTAVAAAIGTGAGGTIGGPLGAAIGAIVGALIGWLIGSLIDFFKAIWEDDVFSAVTVAQTLAVPMPTWGKANSPQGYVWWKGHGGHYKVWYDWEMVP
jgi:hypothetical protein